MRKVTAKLAAKDLNTLFNLGRLYKALDNLRSNEREEKDGAQGVRIVPQIDEDDIAQRDFNRRHLTEKLKSVGNYRHDLGTGKARWEFSPPAASAEERETYMVELQFKRREREGAYFVLLAVLCPGTALYKSVGTETQNDAWRIAAALDLEKRLQKAMNLKTGDDDEEDEDEKIDKPADKKSTEETA